jgi:hypothetical protein
MAPGGLDYSSRRAIYASSPGAAHDALARVRLGDVEELAFEGGREAHDTVSILAAIARRFGKAIRNPR